MLIQFRRLSMARCTLVAPSQIKLHVFRNVWLDMERVMEAQQDNATNGVLTFARRGRPHVLRTVLPDMERVTGPRQDNATNGVPIFALRDRLRVLRTVLPDMERVT